MKEGWEVKTLGEIADVEYGFTDKSTDKGDYRYVRITDIDNNGELISTEKKYLKYSKEAEGFLIRDNDLLMARTGATFAKVLLYKDFEPSVFASYLIRIKFKEKIDNKLYWYFTKSQYYWEQANSLASGAAQPHFNGAAVKQVIFIFPQSLTEQKRIVAILDQAFEAIAKAKANAEQNLKNAKELFDSYLNEIFENKGEGWEEKRLESLIRVNQIGLIKSSKEQGNFKYKYLKMDSISSDNLLFVDKFVYVDANENEVEKFKLDNNDLLFNTRNSFELVGKSCVYKNFKNEVVLFNNNIMRMKFYEDYNPDFINFAFTSKTVKKRIEKLKSGTTSVVGIYYKGLKNLLIPIPKSLEQQTQIVEKLGKLRAETQKLEAIYKQKIEDLEELKKSILQKAFAGELKTVID